MTTNAHQRLELARMQRGERAAVTPEATAPELPSEIWSALLANLPGVYAAVVRAVCFGWASRVAPVRRRTAERACSELAGEGSFDVLDWARSRGFPADPSSLLAELAREDRVDLLARMASREWMPRPPPLVEAEIAAARSGAVRALDWCLSFGGAPLMPALYEVVARNAPDDGDAFVHLLLHERSRLLDGRVLLDARTRWPHRAHEFDDILRARGIDPERLPRGRPAAAAAGDVVTCDGANRCWRPPPPGFPSPSVGRADAGPPAAPFS